MKPKQVNISKRVKAYADTKNSSCTKVIRRRSRSHCLTYDGITLDAIDLYGCAARPATLYSLKCSRRMVGPDNGNIYDSCEVQCATSVISDTEENAIDDSFCKLYNVNQVGWIPSSVVIKNNDKNKENHNTAVRKNRRRQRNVNCNDCEFVPLSIRSYSQPYLYMMDTDDVLIYETDVHPVPLPEKRFRSRSQDDSANGTNSRGKMSAQIETKFQEHYQTNPSDENLLALEPNINATIDVSQINILTSTNDVSPEQQDHVTSSSSHLDINPDTNTADNSYEDEDNIFGNLCHANCTHREHTDSEEDLYHCKEIHNTEVAQRAYRNYIEHYIKLNANVSLTDAVIEASVQWNQLTQKEKLPYFLQAYISQYMPTCETTATVHEEVWEQTSYLCFENSINENYCHSQNSNEEE